MISEQEFIGIQKVIVTETFQKEAFAMVRKLAEQLMPPHAVTADVISTTGMIVDGILWQFLAWNKKDEPSNYQMAKDIFIRCILENHDGEPHHRA